MLLSIDQTKKVQVYIHIHTYGLACTSWMLVYMNTWCIYVYTYIACVHAYAYMYTYTCIYVYMCSKFTSLMLHMNFNFKKCKWMLGTVAASYVKLRAWVLRIIYSVCIVFYFLHQSFLLNWFYMFLNLSLVRKNVRQRGKKVCFSNMSTFLFCI